MNFEWDRRAQNELREAFQFYERRQDGLGVVFRQQVATAIERIANDPTSYESVDRDVYRLSVSRFPFSVIYLVESPSLARILAVKHNHRHPDYWISRLKSDE